jgi:hypothetical protein
MEDEVVEKEEREHSVMTDILTYLKESSFIFKR